MAQYEQQNPEGGLEGFLENVALVSDLAFRKIRVR